MAGSWWEWALPALYGFAALLLGRMWRARRAAKRERRAMQRAAQTWNGRRGGLAEGRRG